ncbi:unnamed protein product, partial [Didymodactylos carnosus]
FSWPQVIIFGRRINIILYDRWQKLSLIIIKPGCDENNRNISSENEILRLLLFTTAPKILQLRHRYAMHSWLQLRPRPKIVVGIIANQTDPKTLQFYAQHDIRVIEVPRVSMPESDGTTFPLLPSLFQVVYDQFFAIKQVLYDIMLYVNADILLMQELMYSIKTAHVYSGKQNFLLFMHRWNIPFEEHSQNETTTYSESDFHTLDWVDKLRSNVKKHGRKYMSYAIDTFAFKPSTYFNSSGTCILEDFAIGGSAWDNYMLYVAKHRPKTLLFDASENGEIAIHLNHGKDRTESHSRNVSFYNQKLYGGREYGITDVNDLIITKGRCACLRVKKEQK